MTKTGIATLAALLAAFCLPAAAQTGNQPQRDAPLVKPSGDTQPTQDRSGSSTNVPSSGQPSGRNNPSISTAPDNAPSRGTQSPTAPSR